MSKAQVGSAGCKSSPFTRPSHLLGLALTLTVFALTVSACSGSHPTTAPQATSRVATPTSAPAASTFAGLRLVAIGDSDAGTAGDSEGKGWVERYADLLEAETGRQVEVANRAQNGQSSQALLSALQGDDGLRADIAAADVVVVGAGGADLNPGDAAWEGGSCSGTPCYGPGLGAYGKNMASATRVVAELRGGRPTLLRAMTLPNGLTGAEAVIPPFLRPDATTVGVFVARSLRTSTCDAVRAVGGQCIDVLGAFNGPQGTQNAYASGLMNIADCCYPSARGHQLIAELLLGTGTKPAALTP